MPFLDGSLEQITASARTISELEFPPPKIFTNALLGNHEITTLIRDTEPHERALFSLDPNSSRVAARNADSRSNGSRAQARKSIFPSGPAVKQSAVARVLGNDMLLQIRQSSGSAARGKGTINVEVLLQGAERLSDAYAVAGATDKIAAIRRRHEAISASILDYQERVSAQQSRLDRYHTGSGYGFDEGENGFDNSGDTPILTEQDFETEETEVRELEAKKRALETRVAGMEKDLGGLLS